MSETVIQAYERTENPNIVRKSGYIPGVIYGKGMKSESVKLEQKEFQRLLHGHTKNTKVNIMMGSDSKQCILKEVQKDPVNGQVLHVGLQTINSEDMIRLRVPILFKGKDKLKAKQQLLQEFISEVELMGKAADMPEIVWIEVGERKSGDKVIVKDIKVSDGIKILDNENVIIAVITGVKEYSEAS